LSGHHGRLGSVGPWRKRRGTSSGGGRAPALRTRWPAPSRSGPPEPKKDRKP
jgi:hypothetical protein